MKTDKLPYWNLTDLYTDAESKKLKADISSLAKVCKEFSMEYTGKIGKLSAKNLCQSIKKYEDISDLAGRIMSFAFLHYCTQVENPEAQSFYQNLEEKINELTQHLIFFSLELNNIEDTKMKELLSDKNLKHYAPFINDSRVWKKYQLSQKEEEIIHEKSLSSRSAWVKLFDQTDAGLRFSFKGKELTVSEIFNKFSSASAEERKLAADSIGEVLQKNIPTFSFIMNTLIKEKELEDKRRGLKEPISSQNLSNLIEDKVVDTLMQTVKDNYPKLSHRYYKIKAKMLGMEKLNYWDRNAAINKDEDKYIPWEQAKETVISAYHEFSPESARIVKMFFDNNWIDASPKQGKMGGAFSHSTVPSCHPYIMMNYHGKTRDVMTLAHELGHGVHQWLSRKQGCLMARTPLTLAETASVFGEQLTFRSLIAQEKDEKKRKLMIASKVEDMLNTVVRQIAMCEFEKQLHAERKNGEISPAKIGDIWMRTQLESFGDSVITDDRYKNYWAYIPHFIHTPFYVYAYAFGDCLVNSLYSVYESGKVQNFESKYMAMLEAGGSLRYKEMLAPFKLDPSKSTFWQQGLDVVSSFIDMLE
jgi:oligoendopeptidase F